MKGIEKIRRKYDKAAYRNGRKAKIPLNAVEKFLGSGFYTGYLPFASGTWGSAAALLLFLIPGFEELYILIPLIIIFTLYGIYAGSRFEKAYGKDPAECTIDEVVGMWITLIAVPKAPVPLLLGFFIWRFFDIIKVPPARNIEKLEGGTGIMLDDVISGIYSLLIIHGILIISERYLLLNLAGWHI